MSNKKIRYAVVGLGHIAQVAVLPAFEHASENSELTAFVTSDAGKMQELSKRYKVEHCYTYEQYDEALAANTFDAVYIALPNDMHKEFTIRAAKAGKHILCEKPMGLNEKECQEMIAAAEDNDVKLMIAYRLHFDKTNMHAVEIVNSGIIGEPRLFNSTFTMQVKENNIRTDKEHGGGPLYDIGIYCLNAARYLFKDEPIEVTALMAQSNDPRFTEVEEAVGAILKFPGERLAVFVASFGSSDVSRYEVLGTEGRIMVDPAYEYADGLAYTLVAGKHREMHKTPKHDQFAPELLHLSRCILNNEMPRPSGYEGLADLRVIDALHKSARTGKSIKLGEHDFAPSKPDVDLIEEKPPVKKPPMVDVESASK